MTAPAAKVKINAFDNTKAAFASVNAGLAKTSQNALRLAGAISGIGFAGAGVAFAALTRNAIQLGSALTDAATATNTGIEQLQALRYAAQEAGASHQQLDNSLVRMQKAAVDASNGLSTYKRAFDTLGIEVKQFIRLPAERKMETIARAMANAGNDQRAYAAVMDILGTRNAPRLIEVLNRLATEGFDAVSRSARAAGQIMAEETAVAMDEVADSLERMKTRVNVTTSGLLAMGLAFGPWGDAAAQVAVLDSSIGKLMDNLESGGNQLYIDQTTEKLKALLAVRQEIGNSIGKPMITPLPEVSGSASSGTESHSKSTQAVTRSMENATKAAERWKLAQMDLDEKLEYSRTKVAELELEYQNLSAVVQDTTSRTEGDVVAFYGKQAELSTARIEQLRLEQKAEQQRNAAYQDATNALTKMSDEAQEKLAKQSEVYSGLTLEVLNANALMVHSMKNASDSLTSEFMNFIETGKFEIDEFAAHFLKTMAQLMIQNTINSALMGMMGDGGGGGILGALFHTGGVVGSSGGSSRAVSPSTFSGAPQYHTGGMAGLRPNEVPAILEKGEEVLTAGDPRHRNNQGGGETVNVSFTVNAMDSRDFASQMVQNKALMVGVINEALARRGQGGM